MTTKTTSTALALATALCTLVVVGNASARGISNSGNGTGNMHFASHVTSQGTGVTTACGFSNCNPAPAAPPTPPVSPPSRPGGPVPNSGGLRGGGFTDIPGSPKVCLGAEWRCQESVN